MDIGSINRTIPTQPVTTLAPSREDLTVVRQIVTAVRGLNKSELMGQNRALTFMRDPGTQRPVIQIVDRETGDVIDQIPAEVILQMKAELDKENKARREE
jgi:uncharacterized FlaG/YvyC family protein